MGFYKEDLRTVKGFVFDVDGVLARSEILLYPDGELMRTMNTKDGYALQCAIHNKYPVGIISGAKSASIKIRFSNLGINEVYLDSVNKWSDFKAFLNIHKLTPNDVLFMGDDLPDLEIMQKVGLPTCPQDAVAEIQAASRYISPYLGGQGCVRDVIEQVLRAQGKWFTGN